MTFSYASKCLPLSILLKHLSWICSTLDIYCTSVRPGRGIPHMWLSLRFLRSFYPVKRVFCSFSLLLLRVKGRGCHTMLKPYETNCDLWIWAIQIKFDWLIDWLMFSFTCGIYCTSVRPGRGIPHMWLSEVSTFFLPCNKFFICSFSLLLLRVKGRGCHTLLKALWEQWWFVNMGYTNKIWLIDWFVTGLPPPHGNKAILTTINFFFKAVHFVYLTKLL